MTVAGSRAADAATDTKSKAAHESCSFILFQSDARKRMINTPMPTMMRMIAKRRFIRPPLGVGFWGVVVVVVDVAVVAAVSVVGALVVVVGCDTGTGAGAGVGATTGPGVGAGAGGG